MRYFLEFAYHGGAYHGWQRQPNAVSVQEVLEGALSTLTGREMELTGAGRTDTGVHARQMFAHFDVSTPLDAPDLAHRLDRFLPEDIAVRGLRAVMPGAHARFDAVSRTYRYHVVRSKDPFRTELAHRVHLPLDMEAMNEAAGMLLEFEDFECFSKAHSDVKTFRCRIDAAYWRTEAFGAVFTIKADRFLRNMVRAVVGTLLEVGTGKREPGHIRQVIESRDRGRAGVSVPAKGLYLEAVEYPETIWA